MVRTCAPKRSSRRLLVPPLSGLQLTRGASPRNRVRARSCVLRSQDVKNTELVTRVVCGSLAADDLVTMDPKEMASSETKKWREQVAEYKKMELMDNMSYQRYAFKGRELPDGTRNRVRTRVHAREVQPARAALRHLPPTPARASVPRAPPARLLQASSSAPSASRKRRSTRRSRRARPTSRPQSSATAARATIGGAFVDADVRASRVRAPT